MDESEHTADRRQGGEGGQQDAEQPEVAEGCEDRSSVGALPDAQAPREVTSLPPLRGSSALDVWRPIPRRPPHIPTIQSEQAERRS